MKLSAISDKKGLIGLIWLGFALRLLNLGKQSLWFDEIVTVHLARLPLLEGLDGLLGQGIQLTPLYHWITKAWLPLGYSEWALRFPAAIFSLACIPLVYCLGRAYFNPAVGMWAAALMAVNPFQIWYAQETRFYSVVAMSAIGAMLAFKDLINGGGKKAFLRLAVFNAIGFSAHYFMFLVPTAQFLFILAGFKKYYPRLRLWLLAQVAGVVPLLPWWGFIIFRHHITVGIGWVKKPTLIDPLLTLWNMTLGYQEQPSPVMVSGLILTALTLSAGALAAWRQNEWGKLVIAWGFLPLVLVPILSQREISFYVDRYFIIITPAIILLLAAGIDAARKIRFNWGLGLLVWLAMLMGAQQVLFNAAAFVKDNWRQAEQILQQNARPGDGLLTCADGYRLALNYYGLSDPFTSQEALYVYPPNQFDFNAILTQYDRLWVINTNPRRSSHLLGLSHPYAPDLAALSPVEQDWVARNRQVVPQTDGISLFLYHLAPAMDMNRLAHWICAETDEPQ